MGVFVASGVRDNPEINSAILPPFSKAKLSTSPKRSNSSNHSNKTMSTSSMKCSSQLGQGVALVNGKTIGDVPPPPQRFSQCTSIMDGADATVKNPSMSNGIPTGGHVPTMPNANLPSPLLEEFEDEETLSVQSFLFPVSNSPLDLITMLTRMAHFTGDLLNVLVPKVSKTECLYADKVSVCLAVFCGLVGGVGMGGTWGRMMSLGRWEWIRLGREKFERGEYN